MHIIVLSYFGRQLFVIKINEDWRICAYSQNSTRANFEFNEHEHALYVEHTHTHTYTERTAAVIDNTVYKHVLQIFLLNYKIVWERIGRKARKKRE